MSRSKAYLLFLSLLCCLGFAEEVDQSPTKLSEINHQITELEEQKRGFESRALWHEDQADRLQFDDQTYLEMRRHNQLAAENRSKAAGVEKEIIKLKQERNKMLTPHK